MIDYPILSLMTFLPLLGVLFIAFIRGGEEVVVRNSKFVALYTSLFTFFISLFMFIYFDKN